MLGQLAPEPVQQQPGKVLPLARDVAHQPLARRVQAAFLLEASLVALLVVVQVEAGRMPVDDPTTHLELTMVHEVMILDHSGPELAALQYASALKMTTYAGLIAALVTPFDPRLQPLACVLFSLAAFAAVAIIVGCVESLVARLRMRWVPVYLMAASLVAAGCMGAAGWLSATR